MNDLTAVGLEWLGALALFLGFIAVVRYLDHRERMTLIERGLLRESGGRRTPRGSGLLRGGLITAMVGFAVTIGLYTLGYLLPEPFSAVPGRLGPWLLPGLIPLAVGVALVASYYLAPPRPDLSEDERAEDDVQRDRPGNGPSRPAGWHVVDGERKPGAGKEGKNNKDAASR
jgi:hypothetical protein